MIKKLLTVATIILLASCSSKSKKNGEFQQEPEVKIEDKSADQSTYQSVADEQQAASLNKETEDQVQEIEVQDRVLFGYDSSEINDAAKKILDTQVSWLKSDPSIKITIEGHCDERGTREYNIALGEKRANAAKNYLLSGGIDKSRIKTLSYGKERPAFFGTSEDILAKNRRAVAVVN
jgi:peptidoglycan-associated lipoprotein